MYGHGPFTFKSKQDVLDEAIRYWNSDKTRFWQKAGFDLHLSGGTYNFGHRHPETVETLKGALEYFDIGNHWLPSVARVALAESLIGVSPGRAFAVFAPGGAEAMGIAMPRPRVAASAGQGEVR